MKVAEILSTPVIGVTPAATVAEAAALLAEHGFGVLPVFGAGAELLGLVTEQDVACVLLAAKPDEPETPARLVRAVMRPVAATTSADTDVVDVPDVLVKAGMRCVPVVSGSRVIGMVGWRDLLATTRRPGVFNQRN